MTSKEKREQMFELVEQWKASGERIKDFVTYQGLSLSKFQYWHKKYRDQQTTAGGFIQMHPAGVTDLRLRYPNGVELLLPMGTAASVIAELIRLG